MSALRALFLVANRIGRVDPGCCLELLGDVALKKVAHVPLSVSTTTRQIDEIADGTEAPLLERINESPWYPLPG